MRFGLLIDFNLLKAATSTNTKPEVILSGCGCHFERSMSLHISAVGGWSDFYEIRRPDAK